jgi:hypothetical protein
MLPLTHPHHRSGIRTAVLSGSPASALSRGFRLLGQQTVAIDDGGGEVEEFAVAHA